MSATKITGSPGWITATIITVLAVAGGLYYGDNERVAARRQIVALRRDIDNQRNESRDLQAFNDDELKAARQRADLFRATLLPEIRVEQFRKETADFWRVVDDGVERTPEYQKVKFELHHNSGPTADWPGILASVKRIQGTPGMTVSRVEMVTSGDANERAFEKVVVGVTLYVKPGKTANL